MIGLNHQFLLKSLASKMKISKDDIKKYLPHRKPFLFIDEVVKIDKNRIFNLGYFTWVEQQGVSLENFEKRKNQEFWNSHYNYMLSLDNQIKEFNSM